MKNSLHDVAAVYNIEFCGTGECLAVWPVKSYEKDITAYKAIKKANAVLKLNLNAAHIPWLLLSSDHLSFRLKGVSNAITLSLLPAGQLPAFAALISGLSPIVNGGKKLKVRASLLENSSWPKLANI